MQPDIMCCLIEEHITGYEVILPKYQFIENIEIGKSIK